MPPKSTQLNPLTAWHLLSLDAPTVVTVWVLFVAHSLHRALPPTLAPALFVGTWILYAADRLLDARRALPGLQPRHHFHQRHAQAFRMTLAIASVALIPLTLELPAWLLTRYTLLAAALAIWLAIVHTTRQRMPKEIAAAIFVTSAVFLPEPPALCSAILFGTLCTFNGLLISHWERSGSPTFPSYRKGVVPFAGVALTILASTRFTPGQTPLLIAASFAAVALLVLHRNRHHFSSTPLRATADAVLLTPLLLWWWPV